MIDIGGLRPTFDVKNGVYCGWKQAIHCEKVRSSAVQGIADAIEVSFGEGDLLNRALDIGEAVRAGEK